MICSIVLSSKVLRLLKITQRQISFLFDEQCKIKYLLDLLGANVTPPITNHLYRKLRDIPVENFPKTKEEIVKIIRETGNEHFKIIHDNLVKTIEETEDVEIRKELETKLAQLQDLKNLADLVDENSSQDYLQTIAQQISQITKEMFNSDES